MIRFSMLFVVLFSLSCSEQIINFEDTAEYPQEEASYEVGEATTSPYYLNFDIQNVDYQSTLPTDIIHMESVQTETKLTFTDILSLDRYLYFIYNLNLGADSVALIGGISFQPDLELPMGYEVIEIEFIIVESKENLELLTDGTYRYVDLELLATRLQTENFGNKTLFGNANINQLMMSFPDVGNLPENWENFTMSSNGFYWPEETLELTHVGYNPESNSIDISGNFNVFLKQLSCGFYHYFDVQNANFQALIE